MPGARFGLTATRHAATWGLAPSALLTAWLLAACGSAPSLPAVTTQAPADCAPATSASPVVPSRFVSTAQPAPPALSLQGQLSVKLEAFQDQPAKGISLGFFFYGQAQTGDLDLMTLLGSQVAHLHWSPEATELVDTNGMHRYASLAELSVAALGEALPLDTLTYWMQGQPDPSLPVDTRSAEGFAQRGWQIDVSELDAKKVTATRPASPAFRGVRVKVYLDR